VPCKRPGYEDIGGTTLGGEATGVYSASIDEAAYYKLEYEEVTGETRSLAAGHFHIE
jgi:hypothetical protein